MACTLMPRCWFVVVTYTAVEGNLSFQTLLEPVPYTLGSHFPARQRHITEDRVVGNRRVQMNGREVRTYGFPPPSLVVCCDSGPVRW